MTIALEKFKEILNQRKMVVGAEISTPCPDIAEIMANMGFDWLFVDTEHAPFDVYALQNVLQAIGNMNTFTMVRPPWNDRVFIKRMLDLGVYGIVIPWVNTEKEAAEAVSYCRYPPVGIRGWGPRRASFYYSCSQEYLKNANEQILVFVQIETAEAVENLNKIVSVNGINGVMVGPADLSFSLKIPLQFDNQKLTAVIQKIVEITKSAGLPAGILCGSPDIAEKYANMGFQMMTIGNDITFIRNGGNVALSKFHKYINTNC